MPFWTIRGQLSARRYGVLAFAWLLIPLVTWCAVSTWGLMDKVFLPSPQDVLRRLSTWFTRDQLQRDIWIST